MIQEDITWNKDRWERLLHEGARGLTRVRVNEQREIFMEHYGAWFFGGTIDQEAYRLATTSKEPQGLSDPYTETKSPLGWVWRLPWHAPDAPGFREQEAVLRRWSTYSSGLILVAGAPASGRTTLVREWVRRSGSQYIWAPECSNSRARDGIDLNDRGPIVWDEVQTASDAIACEQAAFRGHLVCAVVRAETIMHALHAWKTMPGDRFYDPHRMAVITREIIALAQLPRLCECAAPEKNQDVAQAITGNAATMRARSQTGCERCNFYGHDGAVIVHEDIEARADMQKLIAEDRHPTAILGTIVSSARLWSKGVKLVRDGHVDYADLCRKINRYLD